MGCARRLVLLSTCFPPFDEEFEGLLERPPFGTQAAARKVTPLVHNGKGISPMLVSPDKVTPPRCPCNRGGQPTE